MQKQQFKGCIMPSKCDNFEVFSEKCDNFEVFSEKWLIRLFYFSDRV